ncbi:GNAT family N-acetyltransferase [Cereibacter sphaeroides]|uniref:GNAT family N-acetyltransferase n=1 Tax=Cereibacter sphaeroides TaxID=1063 RepID=A0AAX1UH78_CERSP|nr:GNAT family N-acetyltransferase [Cereibacter sphaeroides]RDS93377.1 GNAT family N-acetyltransferase [Cereibacter sphaeroides f. sp. denitrificans]RHZ91846.1 GNAT family N-acetyltransferase [Cereibacter sphaeroides]
MRSAFARSRSSEHIVVRELGIADDLDPILRLVRDAHAESRFSYIAFCEGKARAAIQAIADDRRLQCGFIAWQGGTPIGVSSCRLGECFLGTGVLVATINNVFVARTARRSLNGGSAALGLMEHMLAWAARRGAREIMLHATSGIDPDRTHKLVKRLGFGVVGGSYVRRFQ